MSRCLFSIIVPIYNVEEYLPECVESILNQDFKDFEIIAVDDGSKDNSGKIIDDYAKKDSRIKVIHKENGGLVSARKTGAEKALGKYVLNVDSDDFLEPGALKTISEYCISTDADIVCFSSYRYSSGNKKPMIFQMAEGLYNTEDKFAEIYGKIIYDDEKGFFQPGVYPSLWSKAIKREIYVESQLNASNGVSMGEDLMVLLPSILKAKSIFISNKHLYNYRVNETSISMKYRPNDLSQLQALVKDIKKNADLSDHKMCEQLDVYIYFRTYNNLSALCLNSDSYREAKKRLNEYADGVNNCISHKPTPFRNKKYKLTRFIIDNRIWMYFWLNSLKIKKRIKKR